MCHEIRVKSAGPSFFFLRCSLHESVAVSTPPHSSQLNVAGPSKILSHWPTDERNAAPLAPAKCAKPNEGIEGGSAPVIHTMARHRKPQIPPQSSRQQLVHRIVFRLVGRVASTSKARRPAAAAVATAVDVSMTPATQISRIVVSLQGSESQN